MVSYHLRCIGCESPPLLLGEARWCLGGHNFIQIRHVKGLFITESGTVWTYQVWYLLICWTCFMSAYYKVRTYIYIHWHVYNLLQRRLLQYVVQKPWPLCFPPGLLPLPSRFITPAAQRCEEGTGASKCGVKAKGTGLQHIDRWLGEPGWGVPRVHRVAPGIGPKLFLEVQLGSIRSKRTWHHDRVARTNSYCIALTCFGGLRIRVFGWFGCFMAWQVRCISPCFMSVRRTAARSLPTRSICNENGWEFGPPEQRQSCEWLIVAGGWQPSTCHRMFDPTFTRLRFSLLSPSRLSCRWRFCEVCEEIQWVVCECGRCRATFVHLSRQRLGASWLDVACAAAQSVAQWRPRHLHHADPRGSVYSVQLRSVKVAHPAERGSEKWKKTLRMVSSMCQAVIASAFLRLLSNLLST